MYISFLDYLKELKSKYYIVVLFILFFLAVSYSFNFYKSKDSIITGDANLIKFSTKMKSELVEYNLPTAIEWIGDTAENIFLENKEESRLRMNCNKSESYMICTVKGKINDSEEENKIIDKMITSINNAFDEYETYYIEIIDDMIDVNSNILTFVEGAEDVTVNEIATARIALEKQKMSKIIFSKAIYGSKVNENSISVERYSIDMNYPLTIISALICGLFVIFLQMRDKSKS